MGRHSKCPDNVIVSVAPSSVRRDNNGVLKVQCNIWFSRDIAGELPQQVYELNNYIRNALLAKVEKGTEA